MTAPKPHPSFTLANLVLDAVNLRENSYDYKKSLADTKKTLAAKKVARLAKPDDPMADLYINLCRDDYYKLSMHQAAKEACAQVEADFTDPIYFLLAYVWNDIIEWAESLTGRKFERSAASIQWEKDLDALHTKYESPVKKT